MITTVFFCGIFVLSLTIHFVSKPSFELCILRSLPSAFLALNLSFLKTVYG